VEEDAMMDPKMTMEVPPQVREFAEKSVDQAEKAISSFIESATKSIATVPGPMTEVAKQVLAITEASLKAQFEQARKLMQAKTINEVMSLQSEFMRDQFGAATDQFKKMTSSMLSAGKNAADKTIT
jgi:phasin